MTLWRISNHPTLDGIGGLLVSGRWHTQGRPILYLTLHPATALLETMVHLEADAEDRPARIQVLKIEAPDSVSLLHVDAASLPPGWVDRPDLTQAVGDAWLLGGDSLLLRVPSVLVPEADNVLANPRHPEMPSLRIAAQTHWPLDARLLKAHP